MTLRKQPVYLEGRKFIRDVDTLREPNEGLVNINRTVWLAVLDWPGKTYWTAVRRHRHCTAEPSA